MSSKRGAQISVRPPSRRPQPRRAGAVAQGAVIVGKMKTKRAVAKRFKRTGGGKIMYKQQAQHHLSMQKSSRRMRRLGRMKELEGADKRTIEKLLP